MKIIISEQCKEHMRVHQLDFIVEWKDLIKQVESILLKESMRERFVVKMFDMEKVIGYDQLIKVSTTDEVVYAKRICREGYTKFVRNKKAVLTPIMTVVLNQNRNNPNEYYLVTAYPGKICYKEPQDINITTKQELRACLEFWKQHALIFEDRNIDTSTITSICPYKNLYEAIDQESHLFQ